MPDSELPQKKTFSYSEAAALLPEVRRLTEEACQKVEALTEEATAGSGQAQGRIDEIVTAWAEALMRQGIEVKGLWLIDFDSGSGYYCWRYPEPGLHHFHAYEDGFSGRVPLQ